MAAAGAATRRGRHEAAHAPPYAAPVAEGRAGRHHLRRPPRIFAKGQQRGPRVLRQERTAVAEASLGQPPEHHRWKADLFQWPALGATAPGAAAVDGLLHLGRRPAARGVWDPESHGLSSSATARVVPLGEAPAAPTAPGAASSSRGNRSRCLQPAGWRGDRGGAGPACRRGRQATPPMGSAATTAGARPRTSPSALQAREATRVHPPWRRAHPLAFLRGAGATVGWTAVRRVALGQPVEHAVVGVERGGDPARHACRPTTRGPLGACPSVTDRHPHHHVPRMGGDRQLAAAIAHLHRVAAAPPHRGAGGQRRQPPTARTQRFQA